MGFYPKIGDGLARRVALRLLRLSQMGLVFREKPRRGSASAVRGRGVLGWVELWVQARRSRRDEPGHWRARKKPRCFLLSRNAAEVRSGLFPGVFLCSEGAGCPHRLSRGSVPQRPRSLARPWPRPSATGVCEGAKTLSRAGAAEQKPGDGHINHAGLAGFFQTRYLFFPHVQSVFTLPVFPAREKPRHRAALAWGQPR